MTGYPKWFTWRFVSIFVGLLFITGVMLVPTALDARFDYVFSWRVDPEARMWAVTLHAILAFAMLLILGALWSIHMRVEWKKKRNRASGSLLNILWLGLALTGIGLYYSGGEKWLAFHSGAHIIVGLLVPFSFIHHMLYRDRKETPARVPLRRKTRK